MTNINLKKLEKLRDACRSSAMEFIDIVSREGIEQMKRDGVDIEVNQDFNPEIIGLYAAKSLSVNPDQLLKDYMDFMVLEGLVTLG